MAYRLRGARLLRNTLNQSFFKKSRTSHGFSLDRLNLHRNPKIRPIVLAFSRHQHVEVLVAALTRTLLER